MFEHLRQSWAAFLQGPASPDDRRTVAAEMKSTLVHARMSLDAMRTGLVEARGRLEVERRELETVRRRRLLAEGIGDAETVRVASRFEGLHGDRVTVLAQKVQVQEAELALVEREVAEMTVEWQQVMLGATGGLGSAPRASDGSGHAAEFDADMQLAALKRRMGK
jgi:hypothetical protein